MSFDIGDKIICIDDKHTSYLAALLYQQWPVRRKEYTVRGFIDNDGIVTGMWVEELKNKPVYIRLLGKEQEPAFALWRFAKKEKISPEEISVMNEIKGNTQQIKGYELIDFEKYPPGKLLVGPNKYEF